MALEAANPNIIVAHPSEPAAELRAFLRAYKGNRVSSCSASVALPPAIPLVKAGRVKA